MFANSFAVKQCHITIPIFISLSRNLKQGHEPVIVPQRAEMV